MCGSPTRGAICATGSASCTNLSQHFDQRNLVLIIQFMARLCRRYCSVAIDGMNFPDRHGLRPAGAETTTAFIPVIAIEKQRTSDEHPSRRGDPDIVAASRVGLRENCADLSPD